MVVMKDFELVEPTVYALVAEKALFSVAAMVEKLDFS